MSVFADSVHELDISDSSLLRIQRVSHFVDKHFDDFIGNKSRRFLKYFVNFNLRSFVNLRRMPEQVDVFLSQLFLSRVYFYYFLRPL